MIKIFISYRRDDSQDISGRICDRAKSEFGSGSVFMDVTDIPLGVDFRDHLRSEVERCHVFLAIIGDGWLSATDADGQRRLDDPGDFVRLEISSALSRQIPVIPVLVGRAKVPLTGDLPVELSALAYRNAFEVRSQKFDSDIDDMLRRLRHLIGVNTSVAAEVHRGQVPSKTPFEATALGRTTVPAIGIDLGTTFSAIAHLDDMGRPLIVSNDEGDNITPSIVLFDGDHAIVGREALRAVAIEPESIAECAKREMGSRVFSKQIQGRQYPPEVIQAWILRKIVTDARRKIGDFSHAVITVPAFFDESRRKATQDAGYMAGLDVLDIINEPTAAALAFGYQQGILTAGAYQKDSRILVYDLGGGTFDVTILAIQGSLFSCLATDGDVMLGGRDWDQRLVDYVAESFIKQHGLDPREDLRANGRLWRDCEEAKRTLSARNQVRIYCEFRSNSAEVTVTRALFDDLTMDLLQRTQFTTRQTLQMAGLTWDDVDHVLLVGGSTRMPCVRAMLKEVSGKEPNCCLSADEAVAQGAALHAGAVLAKRQGCLPRLTLKNVNSHSMGVIAIDLKTGQKRNKILIPRSTPLPVSASRVFETEKTGQRSVSVQIVEGESPHPDDCSLIGKCVVRGLPENLPARTPVEVRFHYQENGRLTVNVRVAGTGEAIEHQIDRENSLSPADLNSWRQFIESADDEGALSAE